jgi:hypothetical protein
MDPIQVHLATTTNSALSGFDDGVGADLTTGVAAGVVDLVYSKW